MEIKIWDDWLSSTVKIFVIERYKDASSHIKYTENGLERIEHPLGGQMHPFIEIPKDIFDVMLKEFMIYGSEKGIQTENENVVTGKLIATEKHLEHSNRNLDKLIDFVVKAKK